MRTTTIQPYDVPRFVGDIISQLHEIGHWTTRCCAVLNHTTASATPPIISSTVTPRDSRVSTTILTEMDLIKRNLNVVEKQHNTRLMSEIAYLQCALRSEAEEKMTDFEQYVEAKINQCIEEHTKRVRQEQMEISFSLTNMQDHWMALQTDVSTLSQQLHKVQSTMEMTASRSIEMIGSLHDQLKEASKLRDKHETSLGNQLTQVKLQLQDSTLGCKTTVDQLTARVDIVRNEVKYAIDQLKMQMQQHARALNRVSKGSNLFDMMTPVTAAAENGSPQHAKLNHDTSRSSPPPSNKRRPLSARPATSQPTHIQPALTTTEFVFAQNIPVPVATNEPSTMDIQGRPCPLANPPDCDNAVNDLVPFGDNNIAAHAADTSGGIQRSYERIVPACYVMENNKKPQTQPDAPPHPTTFALQPSMFGKFCEQKRQDPSLLGDKKKPTKVQSAKPPQPASSAHDPRKQKVPQRPSSARPRPTYKAASSASKPVPHQV